MDGALTKVSRSSGLRDFLRLLPQGGPGFVQIALTNACNARCQFCGFSRLQADSWVMADTHRLCQGLPRLVKAGVRYLTITGGEPLLHPDCLEILQAARDHGLATFVCSNGRLLTREVVRALGRAGVSHLIISIDAATATVHEAHRGFPGLCRTLQTLLPEMAAQGIGAVASVTISRLWRDVAALGEFLASLGFRAVTFSYPTLAGHLAAGDAAAAASVLFTAEEFLAILQGLQAWRRQAPLSVLNPSLGIQELQRQLQGLPVRFPCLAGSRYFYIDWHLQVHRCHILRQPLGSLEQFDALPPIRDDCHACLTDCYRDASVQQYPAVVVADVWQAIHRGRWRQALRQLLEKKTFLALAAAWQGRRWFAHGS